MLIILQKKIMKKNNNKISNMNDKQIMVKYKKIKNDVFSSHSSIFNYS